MSSVLCHASTTMGDHHWECKPPQYFTKPPRPMQPPNLSGTGNEYQPECADALWLGSKGRYGSLLVDKRVVGR